MQSASVQTRLVKFFTDRIEQNTGVKIQIGGVDFRPLKSLVLKDVFLEDYRQDTLFYCRDLRMNIDSVHLSSLRFSVKDITLDGAYFNLWIVRGKEESEMNIDVFIKSLQKGKSEKGEKKDSSKTIDIALKNIYVRNSRLIYKENEYEAVGYGINWTDV
ncbi:MAG: hypothetical protein LIO65_09525 [Odoribacter sp.]|nr:hypothetical protein [Odoribacter sp.]